jgi:pimeloyl-ACP methyl ester carboxylesterase
MSDRRRVTSQPHVTRAPSPLACASRCAPLRRLNAAHLQLFQYLGCPNGWPAACFTPRQSMSLPVHEITVHGQSFSYRLAGRGPVLVLLHGITCSSDSWEAIVPALAEHFTVIAPDLMGHGRSAKPAAEYSIADYAGSVRDLLIALGHTRVTLVGHSLGGGVAMQFSYQFPEMTERLVLVSSGGLGPELHPILRMAALPGAGWALPRVCSTRLRELVEGSARLLGRTGLRAGNDLREVWRGYTTLFDAGARRAFLRTVRGAIGVGGQRATALDRLHLAAHLPTLIVWGDEDRIIPVQHAHNGHAGIQGSRLEVFSGAGHFPHLDCPFRFVSLLTRFIQTTRPARVDGAQVGSLVRQDAERETAGELQAA